MKKRFLVVVIVQTILIGVLITYGYVKPAECNYLMNAVHHTEKLAIDNAKRAEELKMELEECRKEGQ